jgi:predicted nucleotidyltransferase component of viral defense system
MQPSRKFLEQAASQTGYQPTNLEKVIKLGDLARDISRHPLLKETLALKGGTALNLGFGPPSRLSVDLDFNYIAQLDRDSMLEDRPLYEATICELAEKKGFRVQQSADAFAGRKIYCSYKSVFGPTERIEVDLNYLFRLPLSKPIKRELWQPGEIRFPKILMVSETELLIGKLLASIDRAAIRDIWDVGRLPLIAPDILNSQLFRAYFIALSVILPHPLYKYTVESIKKQISTRTVENDLMPMLNQGAQADVADIVDQAFRVLDSILLLENHEREYIAKVHQGDLKLSLLFPEDKSISSRLAKHPALAWKIQNVKSIKDN